MSCKTPIAGIIPAAGMSNRFGSPKQLIKLGKRTLIEHVVDTALASRLAHIVLVLGHCRAEIRRALGNRTEDPRLEIVENHAYRKGMSRSVRIGLECVRRIYPSVMFLLADQPLITPELINHLLDRYRTGEKDICVPFCRGRQRNPTLFSRRFYDLIMTVDGDTGARDIIRNHPDHVHYVTVDDPFLFFDIDTSADLDELKARMVRNKLPVIDLYND